MCREQAPAVDLRVYDRLAVSSARLGYLKRDETCSILSRCLKRDELNLARFYGHDRFKPFDRTVFNFKLSRTKNYEP